MVNLIYHTEKRTEDKQEMKTKNKIHYSSEVENCHRLRIKVPLTVLQTETPSLTLTIDHDLQTYHSYGHI